MCKKSIGMLVVKNALAKKGLEIIDLGKLTHGESDYGIALEEGQSIMVMDENKIMNSLTFEEVLNSL